jgi:hypothetical protein
MHFIVNVAEGDGTHFFATAPHSITTEWEFVVVLGTIKEKFPKSEGWEVTGGTRETGGHDFSPEELKRFDDQFARFKEHYKNSNVSKND